MSRSTTPAPSDGGKDGTPASSAAAVGSLSHGLKQRHLSMIALGGVIGAGLFVGSGQGIAKAGPSIVLAYALSGALVMLVMRMLGEMSAANPASGSFSVHAERAFGPWAGFTSGWAFWFLLCVAVGLEGLGAAGIMVGWFPGTPAWAWVALFMLVFCGTNLAAVKNFGEFEFWFAALKIGAIVLFLGIGVLAIVGVIPADEAAKAASEAATSKVGGGGGGFFPNGVDGLIFGLLASLFAYGGLETVTIAAAESEHPVQGVAKAVRTAMWRIAIFYIGSMAVIVAIMPWNDPAVAEKGPYVATLDYLGIPAAGQIMNVVVLVALLSAMNANIYGASRMACSLVARRMGPQIMGRTFGGVPRLAVLASCVLGFGCVMLSFWSPDKAFIWLLNTIGAIILVVWFFIGASQLALRGRTERETPEKLVVKMWLFPGLTITALVGMVVVFILMAMEAETREQLYYTGGLTVLLAIVGYVLQKKRGDETAAEAALPGTTPAEPAAAEEKAEAKPKGKTEEKAKATSGDKADDKAAGDDKKPVTAKKA
ncbi:amino acid permease [Streptomyces sp. NPDC048718]|uniref:amino acid permease n=1 Tax=Streptomyces sp. NPDC048718 TaxID=3365587 RepID=UPI00371E3DD3